MRNLTDIICLAHRMHDDADVKVNYDKCLLIAEKILDLYEERVLPQRYNTLINKEAVEQYAHMIYSSLPCSAFKMDVFKVYVSYSVGLIRYENLVEAYNTLLYYKADAAMPA